MSKHTIIRDSTQISSFLDCPQMWDYDHNQHLQLTLAKPNDAMIMGSYGHEMLERYYKMRAINESITNALESVLEWNPDTEFCQCGHTIKHHITNMENMKFEQQKCTMPQCQCQNFNSTMYPLDNDQRKIVKDKIRLYTYTYAADDFVPQRPEHVEVGFSHKLYEDDEKLFILEGKVDLMMPHRGMATWTDHKFQMSAHELYQKDIQFRNYDLVMKAAIACINYIRLTKKVDHTTFVRRWFGFSIMERAFWERRLIEIFNQMLELELSGIQPHHYHWNMCKGRFKGHTCAFTQLCEEAYLPHVVEARKKQAYHIRPVWQPW